MTGELLLESKIKVSLKLFFIYYMFLIQISIKILLSRKKISWPKISDEQRGDSILRRKQT